MTAPALPFYRALGHLSQREHHAVEAEIVRRTASDVQWQALNDRIIAGLRRSAEADARALARITGDQS